MLSDLNLPFVGGTRDQRGAPNNKTPLNSFISEVKGGGLARTNRYAVLMKLPFRFPDNILRKALLFCDQIQLPGVNFSTAQNRSYGEFREAPYEKLYEHINLSFYVDKDMQVKELFDRWIETIYNPQTRTFNYYDNYVTDIKIKVQDISDRSHYYVTLYECFPKSVGAVQLDYASKDVMKLSVSMAYKWADATTLIPDGFQGIPKPKMEDKLMNFAIGTAGSWAVTKIPSITSNLPKLRF